MFRKILAITSLLGSTYSPPKPQAAGASVADLEANRAETSTVQTASQKKVVIVTEADRFSDSSRQNLVAALLNSKSKITEETFNQTKELMQKKFLHIDELTLKLSKLEDEKTQLENQTSSDNVSDEKYLKLRKVKNKAQIEAAHLELMTEFFAFLNTEETESEESTVSIYATTELDQMLDYTKGQFYVYKLRYPERVAAYQNEMQTAAKETQTHDEKTDKTQTSDDAKELDEHVKDEVASDQSLEAKQASNSSSSTPQRNLSAQSSGSDSSSSDKTDASELATKEAAKPTVLTTNDYMELLFPQPRRHDALIVLEIDESNERFKLESDFKRTVRKAELDLLHKISSLLRQEREADETQSEGGDDDQ